MIKYFGKPTIVFSEFPDQISLVFNISNCPGTCDHCSEPELRADVGIELTDQVLEDFINSNPGITLCGFLGGDSDHARIGELADLIHSKYPELLVGFYSGRDYLDLTLVDKIEYYKIGRWITPVGNQEDWWKTNCGPLKFTFSNQLMFKRVGNELVNITDKFRKEKINNLEREIIK